MEILDRLHNIGEDLISVYIYAYYLLYIFRISTKCYEFFYYILSEQCYKFIIYELRTQFPHPMHTNENQQHHFICSWINEYSSFYEYCKNCRGWWEITLSDGTWFLLSEYKDSLNRFLYLFSDILCRFRTRESVKLDRYVFIIYWSRCYSYSAYKAHANEWKCSDPRARRR